MSGVTNNILPYRRISLFFFSFLVQNDTHYSIRTCAKFEFITAVNVDMANDGRCDANIFSHL